MQQPCPVRRPDPAVHVPFFDDLFRAWHLKKNAKQARSGDRNAARLVACQYCSCPDGSAEACLGSLLSENTDPVIRDAICEEALESGSDLLLSAIRNFRVIPSTTAGQALFFYATGRISEYQDLAGKKGHTVLRKAYTGANEEIRGHVRAAAIRYRAEAIFADAILHLENPDPALHLSFQEWKIAVVGLIAASRYAELYRLLLDAPVPYSLHAILALKEAGWKPANRSVRELWERVAGSAPERWTFPVLPAREHSVLVGPDTRTRFLAFSPDGSLLVTSGNTGTIRIWDVLRGELVSSSENDGNAGSCPVFSPDGHLLLSCSRDGILACREIPSCHIRFIITGCSRNGCAIAISGDNLVAAYAKTEGGIGIVTLPDGCPAGSNSAGDFKVTALAFSLDNKRIVCGSPDGTIRLIAVADGSVLWTSSCGSGRIGQIAFLAKEEGTGIIAIAGKYHPVFLDEETGFCIRKIGIPAKKPRTASLSADSRWIFVTCEDDSISVFSTDRSKPETVIPARNGGAASAAFIPGQRIAVTGGINGIVRIFRFGNDAPDRMFTAHGDWILALAVSPDGKILASAGWDGTTKLWSLPDGNLLRSLDAHSGSHTCLAGSGDGTVLAVGTSEGLVRFWRLPEGEYLSSMDAFTGSVRAIAVNSDGTLLATTGSDATVRIWGLPGGSLITTLQGLTTGTYCLAFTPDNRGVLAGGWDNTVRLFGLPDGALLRTFAGHANIITGIAVAPDGTGFVSGSFDGSCRIWDLAGGDSPIPCKGSGKEIDAVAISADGLLIAAAERDATIRIFNRNNGTFLYTLTGATSRITGLTFITDGNLLVASGSDGSVSCFSTSTRTHIRNFSAHAGKICGLARAAGSDVAVSAGTDGTVRLLSLPFSAPLSSMNPDIVPVIAQKVRDHHGRRESQQWEFLISLLALKFSSEICICSPLPSVGELDIMIVG